MQLTYTADHITLAGPTRKIIHVFGAKAEKVALRAVQRYLAQQGIDPVVVIRVPPRTPLEALETESYTMVYLPVGK